MADEVRIPFEIVDHFSRPMRDMEAHYRELVRLQDELNKKQRMAANSLATWQGVAEKAGGAIAKMARGAANEIDKLIRTTIRWSEIGAAGAVATSVMLTRTAVNLNKEWLQYRLTLETVQKSQAKANATMSWMVQFAAKTPFQLQGVAKYGAQLEATGLSARKWLPLIGDLTSAFGQSEETISQMVWAIAQLKTGVAGHAFRSLSTLGISREEFRRQGIEFTKAGQLKSSPEDALDALEKIIKSRFGGMMARLTQTFIGRISNIKDILSYTLREVSEPLFDELGKDAKKFLDYLDAINKTGARQVWVNNLGKQLADLYRSGSDFIKKTIIEPLGRGATLGQVGEGLWNQLKDPAIKFINWFADKLISGLTSAISRVFSELANNPEARSAALKIGLLRYGPSAAGTLVGGAAQMGIGYWGTRMALSGAGLGGGAAAAGGATTMGLGMAGLLAAPAFVGADYLMAAISGKKPYSQRAFEALPEWMGGVPDFGQTERPGGNLYLGPDKGIQSELQRRKQFRGEQAGARAGSEFGELSNRLLGFRDDIRLFRKAAEDESRYAFDALVKQAQAATDKFRTADQSILAISARIRELDSQIGRSQNVSSIGGFLATGMWGSKFAGRAMTAARFAGIDVRAARPDISEYGFGLMQGADKSISRLRRERAEQQQDVLLIRAKQNEELVKQNVGVLDQFLGTKAGTERWQWAQGLESALRVSEKIRFGSQRSGLSLEDVHGASKYGILDERKTQKFLEEKLPQYLSPQAMDVFRKRGGFDQGEAAKRLEEALLKAANEFRSFRLGDFRELDKALVPLRDGMMQIMEDAGKALSTSILAELKADLPQLASDPALKDIVDKVYDITMKEWAKRAKNDPIGYQLPQMN